jgi:hypothetical protein
MKDGMNGASGGNAHVAGKPSDQELADLASAPMRLVALEGQDEAFDLLRELVGIAHRPPRPVVQSLDAVFLVAVEDFVTGLTRDAERTADLRHWLAIQKLCDKPQALVHDRTLLPRHSHLPP